MMMKKVLCALGVLAAVPAFAQDKTVTLTDPRKPITVHVIRNHGPLSPSTTGIPPEIVEQLGLPTATVKKVQDLLFASNDQLISLEADHKRAQLSLDRELKQDSPNEATVKDLVEKVGRAETAVRQNRVGVMVSIKKLLGPETWSKVESSMRPTTPMPPMPPMPAAHPASPAPPAPAPER